MRKLYRKVRELMPVSVQGRMSRAVFALAGKPYVRKDKLDIKDKFPGTATGAMAISTDFELAWGWRYAKRAQDPLKKALSKAKQARENFPTLLTLFETYHIPITWATVGFLFLKEGKKSLLDAIPRIPYFENQNWLYNKGDWFDNVPLTDWKQGKEWYAPDLLENILNSHVKHEIGCHTFSHLDFTYRNCPATVAEHDLIACKEAAKPWGIQLKSFVFPGGTFGNYEMLKKHGIEIFRKSLNCDLAYPFMDEYGLIETARTDGFEDKDKYGWSEEYIISRFKTYIDKAIKTGTVAHFWFHPELDPYPMNKIMPHVLKYAAEKREKGQLWIATMEELAGRVKKVCG